MSFLESIHWHVVGNNVVSKIHVLLKQGLELVVSVETLSALVWQNKLPHELSLALGTECLIRWSIEVRGILWEVAICIRVRTTISFGLVISPVVEAAVRASDFYFWLRGEYFHNWITAARLLFITSNTALTV